MTATGEFPLAVFFFVEKETQMAKRTYPIAEDGANRLTDT
jgi:hypothetical protein